MLYCDRCQVLSEDEETCPLCGGHKLRPAAANDPVLLFTTCEEEAQRIAAAFDDERIPHMERMQEGGSASSIVLGRSRCAQMRIFVPFGEIGHARDVMHGIGALKDGWKEDAAISNGDSEAAPQKAAHGKEEVPMSRGRRIALRIFSIIMFLILVSAVVFGADAIVNAFKSMFH